MSVLLSTLRRRSKTIQNQKTKKVTSSSSVVFARQKRSKKKVLAVKPKPKVVKRCPPVPSPIPIPLIPKRPLNMNNVIPPFVWPEDDEVNEEQLEEHEGPERMDYDA